MTRICPHGSKHRFATVLGRLLALTFGATAIAASVDGAHGQVPEVDGLAEAVTYYHQHATSDLAHLQEATRRFEALAIAHPADGSPDSAWLPAYWTAMAYSQLAMFAADERMRPFVDLAQVYYEKAWEVRPPGSDREADFFALKALILRFVAATDPERADEYAVERVTYQERARTADPDNPMVVMSEGLTMLRDGDDRDAAYDVLDRAIKLYEPRLGTVLPNWGREFIDVWMGRYPRGGSS